MISMGKEANIAKVHFLMKEKGMSAMEAIKSAYPEWPEEKVKALAAKLEGMKDAGMSKAKKEAPAEEKTAGQNLATGIGAAMPLLSGAGAEPGKGIKTTAGSTLAAVLASSATRGLPAGARLLALMAAGGAGARFAHGPDTKKKKGKKKKASVEKIAKLPSFIRKAMTPKELKRWKKTGMGPGLIDDRVGDAGLDRMVAAEHGKRAAKLKAKAIAAKKRGASDIEVSSLMASALKEAKDGRQRREWVRKAVKASPDIKGPLLAKSASKKDQLGFMDTQRAAMRALSSGKASDQSLIASEDTIKRRLKAQGKGFATGAPLGALAGLALAGKGGRALGAAIGGLGAGAVGQIVGQTRSDLKFLKAKGIDIKWHGLSAKITPKGRAKYFPEHKSLTDKTAEAKIAKLRVHDIEDEIGDYLSDADETKVRRMITKAKKKSFSMRHPVLTGIPTLGIAPAMANNKAKMKIIRQLAKSDPKMRKRLRKMREAARREQHEMSVAKASAPRTNVSVHNDRSKEASLQLVALQHGSQALYTGYMQKHALLNPVTTAKISKAFKSLLAKAKPAAKTIADTTKTTVKSLGDKAAKTFPDATAKSKAWLAEFVKKNPEAAAAIKKNWKPALGGAAAGAIISKAMSD